MANPTADVPETHIDLLHRPVGCGDYVALSHHNSLYIGKVMKVTPKMFVIDTIRGSPDSYGHTGIRKYPIQLVKVDEQDVTLYLLKGGRKS